MAADFKVFFSAVSGEFEAARDALQAVDGITVRIQRSFRHDPNAPVVA
jgi:hypothetical protein